MDTPAGRGARCLALLTAWGALAVVAAALYAALWAPGSLDLSARREAARPGTVTWVAPDGPAWSNGVMPGDTIAGHPALGHLVIDHGPHRIILGPAATRGRPA